MADAEDFADDAGYDEPQRPKAQITPLTMVLIVLNMMAALAFVYLLAMNFQKRQEWMYHVFMHDLLIQGLPVSGNDEGPNASRVTQPAYRLDNQQLREAYLKRGGKPIDGEFEPAGAIFMPVPAPDGDGSHDYKDGNWIANKSGKGTHNFMLINPHHNPRQFITADQLSPDILKDFFGDLGGPVKTLETEIRGLKNRVPEDIAKAAQEYAAQFKTEGDKRKQLGTLLLPMTTDIYQVEALAKWIAAAKAAELDNLLAEAAERRMLFELLMPLESHRPGDLAYRQLERAADFNAVKLEELKNRLERRFEGAVADEFFPDVHQGKDWEGQKRDSVEKRRTIGFLLVALANLKRPDGRLLYDPKESRFADRVELILGVPEHAVALQAYGQVWPVLEAKAVEAIQIDRRGFDGLYKGNPALSQAFLDQHQTEISRIKDIVDKIRQAQGRLKVAQEQNAQAKKLYEDRYAQQAAVTKQLVAARAETFRLEEELRALRKQLFDAQLELSEAREANVELEKRIHAAEKGGKAP